MVENNSSSNIKISLVIFWVLAAAMMFIELGTVALWGSEDRWAEISRIMLMSGDWLHPSINGEIYFDKPLLSYWFIAVPGLLTGFVNEFIIRLPSAIAGLAGIWATYMLGKKLWSRQVAIFAAWVLLTAMGFIFWSRKGAADVENMSAIILAVTWYFYCRDKAGFFSYFLFFFICAAGAHTKGLPAIIVPLVAIFPDLIRHNNWKKHLKVSFFAAGIVCAGLYFLPFIVASLVPLPKGWEYPPNQLTGLELVWRENVVRAFKSYDHNKEPFFSYLYHIPRLMVPWTVLFVIGLIAMIPSYKKLEEKNRWLLEVMLLILLLFTASGSKRWYYILPIVPFCSIFTGVFVFEKFRDNWKNWTYLLYKYASMVCGIALLFTIPVYMLAKFIFKRSAGAESKLIAKLGLFQEVTLDTGWLIALTLMGVIILLPWMLYRADKERYMGWMFGAGQIKWAPLLLSVWGIMFMGMCVFPSAIEQFRTERGFAREFAQLMRERKIAPSQVAFYRKPSTKTVFYALFSEPVIVINDERKGDKVITKQEKYSQLLNAAGTSKYIICQERYVNDMKNVVPESKLNKVVLREKTFPWEKAKKTKRKKNIIVFEIEQRESR